MAHELSPGKSVCILAIVVGCFAILWPNIFYPMLKSSLFTSSDGINGCCHVLHDKDVNGVKLVSELCNAVFKQSEAYQKSLNLSLSSRSTKDSNIKFCRSVILDTCGVDIHVLLKDKIQLDPRYKQTLDDLRTFNKSLCLKYHFDVTLELLGAPHRIKYNYTSSSKYHHRQERSPYTRPNGLHPAFRDRNRPGPLPQPQSSPRMPREKETAPPPVITGKKPPIPGMRPPIGAGSHMQSQKGGGGGGGTMGVLMPMYTIGIVIFFGYTIMKLLCRKHEPPNAYSHDPDFCRIVFNNNSRENKTHEYEKTNGNLTNEPTSKLVVTAISGLLQEVNRDILERKTNDLKNANPILSSNEKDNSESNSESELQLNGNIKADNVSKEEQENNDEDVNSTSVNKNHTNEIEPTEKEKAVIEVLGMELNERCENGELWKNQIPVSNTSVPPIELTPQEIILPTNVPINSHILVTDAHTESVENEPSVILESKVTLNVIAPDKKHENTLDYENEKDENVCQTKKYFNHHDISDEEEEEEEEEQEQEETEIEVEEKDNEEEDEEIIEEEEEIIEEEEEEEEEIEEIEEEDEIINENDSTKKSQKNQQITEM